jgi:putative tryptophan/tyrosine transport system substrate-binding protein
VVTPPVSCCSLAQELVRRQVAVIVTLGTPGALAAKAATTIIPIAFLNGSDPVQIGLVASLARPNGNITGITNIAAGLIAKRVEVLRQLVPTATSIALLVNPANSVIADAAVIEGQTAARALGVDLLVVSGRSGDEIAAAVSSLGEQRVGALLVAADPLYFAQIEHLVSLAGHYAIPTSYEDRLFTAAGGLISYGPNQLESCRQLGILVSRLLKGEKPSDLPVEQPTKFELIINLKTAKALGLTIPETLLATADEVIQ